MKLKETWLFNPARVSGIAASEASEWYGKLLLGLGISEWQVAVDVANETGMTPYQVLHVFECRGKAIMTALKSGRNVNTPLVGYRINMTGGLERSDSEFDPALNALEVSAYAKPLLRDCLKREGIVPHNTVPHLTASLGSVMDSVAREEGVLTVPERGLGAGRNLLIGNHPDEGLRLLTKKGELAATPTVLANDSGTIDFALGDGFAALEDGEYVLELSARNGASTDYAPAVTRKAVTIRKAI